LISKKIAVTDSSGREITTAFDSIRIYVDGDGKVTAADGNGLVLRTDTAGKNYAACQLVNGTCHLLFIAGMKFLLDFHYSDYWADPQQQYKPLAWTDLDFETLKDSLKTYTTNVLLALKQQGTMPAMIQIGNEINHGILWPDGHISHPDQLADLLKAGIEGVETIDPGLPVMMHIALGCELVLCKFRRH